jgi:DNA-binding beta-propeller fold protein YncE
MTSTSTERSEHSLGIVYDHTVGFQANQGRGFNNPVDLALDSQGVMYVLNRAGPETAIRLPYKRVTICTAEEEYLGEFGTGGTGKGEFWWPSSLAFDGDGRLYVADEALQRISVFSKEGAFLNQWGAEGNGEGQLNRPSSIAFDQENHLYVSDSLNHRVQKFTKEGRFLAVWGGPGPSSEPGRFNMPWGIAMGPDGDIHVADWRNDRVQRFNPKGEFLGAAGEPGAATGQLNRPAGIAVDHQGNLYVADWGNERVQVFGPGWRVLADLRGDSAPSKWAQDYFDANPDEAKARLASDLEPDVKHLGGERREESANIEKLFWGATAVKLDAQGHIYVVDSLRHRVQIYRWRISGESVGPASLKTGPRIP